MNDALRAVGMRVGGRNTTFADDGVLYTDSPFRRAFGHCEPTVVGFVAGAVRLLRDPFVVCALTNALSEGERTLVDHLLSILDSQVAAVFGDRATFNAIQRTIEVAHRRRIRANDQPDWFVRATGERKDYVTGEERLKRAVNAALLGGITEAHLLTGLVPADNKRLQYVIDVDATLGAVAGAPLFSPTMDVHHRTPAAVQQLGTTYEGLPLMNNSLLVESGAVDLLAEVLATELAPDVPISDYMAPIGGCMYPADREAFGLYWGSTEEVEFDAWCKDYRRIMKDLNAHPGSPTDFEHLFFTAAKGRIA